MKEFYKREGYYLPDFITPSELLGQIKELILSKVPKGENRFFTNPHLDSESNPLLDFVKQDKILDLVEELLGKDILFWKCHVQHKESQRPVNWHQDSSYYTMNPANALTIWLAIQDVDKDNGCVVYGKRTHIWNYLAHEPTNDGVFRNAFPKSDIERYGLNKKENVVDIERKAGQISIHHTHLIHASRPNLSRKPRTGIAFRFMSGDCLLEEGDSTHFKTGSIILRGNDLRGNKIVGDFTNA